MENKANNPPKRDAPQPTSLCVPLVLERLLGDNVRWVQFVFSSIPWPHLVRKCDATRLLLPLHSLSSICQYLGYHTDYVQLCRPLFEQALNIPSGTKRIAESSFSKLSKKPRIGQSFSSTVAVISRSDIEGIDHWAHESGMYQSVSLNERKSLICRRQFIPWYTPTSIHIEVGPRRQRCLHQYKRFVVNGQRPWSDPEYFCNFQQPTWVVHKPLSRRYPPRSKRPLPPRRLYCGGSWSLFAHRI